MVSRKQPDAPAGLDGFLRLSRDTLFGPWQEALATSSDLQGDVHATVRELQVFFHKWVVEIIVVLAQRGTLRFNELKENLPGISGRTLSLRLKDLEQQGLVRRALHDQMPVRVDYSLTKRGTDVAVLALPLVLYLLSSRR